MPTADDRQMMRLLHGELDAAAAAELRAAIAADPAARRRWEALSRTWEGLELPPPAPPAPGFAARVGARARAERRGEAGPLPWPARWAAAAALATGIALGVGVTQQWRPAAEIGSGLAEEAEAVPDTLASDYWAVLAGLAADDGGSEP